MSEFVVNKIGGTSAGNPENIMNLAASPEGTFIPGDHEGDPSMALVVSAIGGVEDDDRRVTSMTREYFESVRAGNPDGELRADIVDRHRTVYSGLGQQSLARITDELNLALTPDEDKTEADYVSLGEEYSAKLLAEAIGGRYVAPEHIRFRGASYDLHATVDGLKRAHAAGEFDIDRPLVYAGYFGFDGNGGRQLLDAGGSDRTALALASGLNSDFYGKWSDIEGIHTANPSEVQDTVIRRHMTIAEIREYALGGNPVLNGRTPVDIDQLGWDGTLMIRSTFNPSEPGTRITSSRLIDPEEPVAAIAARDVDMISINDLGMAHKVGYVAHVASFAESLGLSISHFPAGNDALTFVIDPDKGDVYPGENGQEHAGRSYRERLEELESYLQDNAISPNSQVTTEQDRALVVLVGEALRTKDIRTFTNARFNLALLRGGVAVRDTLGNIQSPSLVFEVDRKETGRCQELAHSEFVSDPALRDLLRIPTRKLKEYGPDRT